LTVTTIPTAATAVDPRLARSFLDRDPEALLTALVALPAAHPSRSSLRERVIEAWLPLAHHLARRFGERNEPLEDLCQVAAIGLIKAVDRFDPTRGGDFVAFAVPTITGEIKRHFRDHTWPVHVRRHVKDLIGEVRDARETLEQQLRRPPTIAELAGRLKVDEAVVVEATCAATAYRSTPLDGTSADGTPMEFGDLLGEEESRYELIENRPALAAALADLDSRAREVLFLRFFHDLSQQQIADRVGVSQMHVSRIITRAIGDLRHSLGATPG
jgi:RNA polymerase sigma-B factor